MSNIIEINYEDTLNRMSDIIYHLECDGFVKIIFNESIDLSQIIDSAIEFFDLSNTEKNMLLKNSKDNTNMYYGYFPSTINGKEGLDIPDPKMDTTDFILCEQIKYPPTFTSKNTIDNYFKLCHSLGTLIIIAILGSKKADELCNNNKHLSVLRFNYYPKHSKTDDCVEISNGIKLACDTHVDDSLLTLLYQNNVPGLQVYNKQSDKWEDVSPSNNSILINSGKLLALLTNNRFEPVYHRVLQNYEKRYSVPYFMGIPAHSHVNDKYKTYVDYLRDFTQKKEYAHINTLLQSIK